MPYRFSFDLSSISKAFFRDLANVAKEKDLHRKIGNQARHLAEKFKIQQITGLEVSDALMLIEDLVDIYVKNISDTQKFSETRKRAVFLPHCARKYMDNKCKAQFEPEIPSYRCQHCSPDCMVNRATKLAEKNGYEVYVVAGSSCIPQILKKNGCEGVIGVACSDELKMGADYIGRLGLAGQAVPLTKNGCANTKFSLRTLKNLIEAYPIHTPEASTN